MKFVKFIFSNVLITLKNKTTGGPRSIVRVCRAYLHMVHILISLGTAGPRSEIS